MTPLVQTVKPHMSFVIRCNVQLLVAAIRAFFHNYMDVKTVLNLEASTGNGCQDAITYAQQVGYGD